MGGSQRQNVPKTPKLLDITGRTLHLLPSPAPSGACEVSQQQKAAHCFKSSTDKRDKSF